MSETDKPDPSQPAQPQQPPQSSGAEAPAQPDQPAPESQAPQEEQTVQAPPAQAVPPPPPPPAPKRPPHMVRTWLAAAIGGVILVGAGLGGYFIGTASDHHGDRPGVSRFGDHRPFGPGYGGPRGDLPRRGGAVPG